MPFHEHYKITGNERTAVRSCLYASIDFSPTGLVFYTKLNIYKMESVRPRADASSVDDPTNLDHEEALVLEEGDVVENNSVTVELNRSYLKKQIKKEGVKTHLKNNFKTCYKPKVSGTIAGTIESFVNDIDRSPDAFASGPGAEAGTYTTRMGTGAFARASVGDAEAHVSIAHARANGPVAGVGANLSWVQVGAHAVAELARAEVSIGGVNAGVGFNLNTGVSAGIDGVSANFLGFGITLGPTLAVRTPVVDLSCCIT